jgi:membrane-bound lytic murein transglycosylase B
MVTRRVVLAAPLAALPLAALPLSARAAGGFPAFLAGVRAEAVRAGVSPAIADQALHGLRPNPRVIELDNHQPEFSLTWAQYKARVLPAARMQAARAHAAQNATLLAEVVRRYGAEPGVIIGIWGLESGFGAKTGSFSVVESLATLAYSAHRAAYFRHELINALKILNAGDITPRFMTGSWAGAMGQPQFMPSSYLEYAVDFTGNGRRDIWTDRADVFASVANYLGRCGWRPGEPWGQPVLLPPGFAGPTGREITRTLGAWQAQGVRRIDGQPFSRTDVHGAIVQPDGPGTEAFMVYANFHVIRRYNPSDFYALGVGLLGIASA